MLASNDPSTAPNSLARTLSPEQEPRFAAGVVEKREQPLALANTGSVSPALSSSSPSPLPSSPRTNRQLLVAPPSSASAGGTIIHRLHEQQQHLKATPSIVHNPALQELQANLVMQDRIIATLETDNERLLQENKALRNKLKEAQEKANIAIALSQPTTSSVAVAAAASPIQNQHQQIQTMSPETAITVASLREEIARQRQEIDTERKDMVRKISWYVDRQEVSAAHDALVAEQQQQIRDLRLTVAELDAQVMILGGGGKSSSSSLSSATEKDKQIRTLTRRVAELEDSLRNNHPDSLTELIRATRPPLTEAAEFKKMKAQLEEANRRLENQEQSAQRSLAQLRVDSDSLRNQYAKRLEKVEEEMKLRIAATQTRKTKELGKSLDDTRRYYSQKVKDLEEQLAGYRRGDHNSNSNNKSSHAQSSSSSPFSNAVPPHFSLPTATSSTPNSQVQDKEGNGKSSATVRSRSAALSANSRSSSDNNDTNNNIGQRPTTTTTMMMMTPFGPMPMPMPRDSNPSTMQMQMQMPHGGMALNNLCNGMYQSQQQPQQPMLIPVTDPSMQQRIWFLETRVKTLEEENRFLQKQASESVLSTGAAAAVQSQLGASQREVIALQRLLREAQDQHCRVLHELEDRLHNEREVHSKEAERLTAHHRDEMKALQTRCDAEIRLRSESVTARQLMAFSSGLSNVMGTDLGANASTKELRRYLLLLAERVHCLERQLAATESEHTRQLSELKRVSEFELEVEKQKLGIALKQKNAEIDAFKVQLDSMLEQIAKLRGK